MIESADGSTDTGPHLPARGKQAHPARHRRDTARARRNARGTSSRQRHRLLILDRAAPEVPQWHR